MSAERMTAVTTWKRHGAWFIVMSDPDNDSVPIELYDCASSLVRAKHIGRVMAEEFGYEAPFAWKKNPEHDNWWDLRASWNDEEVS